MKQILSIAIITFFISCFASTANSQGSVDVRIGKPLCTSDPELQMNPLNKSDINANHHYYEFFKLCVGTHKQKQREGLIGTEAISRSYTRLYSATEHKVFQNKIKTVMAETYSLADAAFVDHAVNKGFTKRFC